LFDGDGWKSLEELEEEIESIGMDLAAPLGHAAAIHWPDRPYAKWKSNLKFPDGRDNTEEFMEASLDIYGIMASLQCLPSTELPADKKALLLKAFQEIKEKDPEERNAKWLEKIHNNEFQFADFCDEDAKLELS